MATTTATPQLQLQKRSSVLHQMKMFEIVPEDKLKAIIKSEVLQSSWGDVDMDDPHKAVMVKQYEGEKAMFAKYAKNYTKLNNGLETFGGVLVEYVKPKHGFGRAYPKHSLGLTCFRRPIRNSLITGLWYDADMKNAQFEIVRNICENYDIDCTNLKYYCANREGVFRDVMATYKVTKEAAKKLFTGICFGGTFSGWCRKQRVNADVALPFIQLMEKEMNAIALKIKAANKPMYESVRRAVENKGENRPEKLLASFFSVYLQEQESRIVEALACYITNHTDLMSVAGVSRPVATYEYDGMKLLKANVDLFEDGMDGVIQMLNEKTLQLTGFRLEWANKEMDGVIDLLPWIEQVKQDNLPNADLHADMKIINDAIESADCGVIETIMRLKPDHFVHLTNSEDAKKGTWFGWNGKRWEKSDAPLRMEIMYGVPKYWMGLLEKWNNLFANVAVEDGVEPDKNYKLWMHTKKAAESRIRELKTLNGVSRCVGIAQTKMNVYRFEFDTNIHLFGCENGVIDIENECFRPYRFDDRVTMSCGIHFIPQNAGFKVLDHDGNVSYVVEKDKHLIQKVDGKVKALVMVDGKEKLIDINDSYETNEAMVKINETYERIFPDEEVRKFTCMVMATGMSGKAIPNFFIFNGGGRNGKGLTDEFLQSIYGDYFANLSWSLLTENPKNKASGAANPEMVKINKARYCVMKEPPQHLLMQNSVMKDITGGGEVIGRALFSGKTNIKLHGTMVMECNKKPNFAEDPTEADAMRIVDILFGSKFVSDKSEVNESNHAYAADANIKDLLTTSYVHKNMMLNMLLAQLFELKKKNYDLMHFRPESIKNRSLEYLQNSFALHTIFMELFELRIEEHAEHYKDKDKDWTLAEIVRHIRCSADFRELPKHKKTEYTAAATKEFFLKNKFYKQYIEENKGTKQITMKNWRLKPILADDEVVFKPTTATATATATAVVTEDQYTGPALEKETNPELDDEDDD